MLEFDYDGYHRVVQPTCHGFTRKGAETLRAVQVNADGRPGGRRFGRLWTVTKMQEPARRRPDLRSRQSDYNRRPALIEISLRREASATTAGIRMKREVEQAAGGEGGDRVESQDVDGTLSGLSLAHSPQGRLHVGAPGGSTVARVATFPNIAKRFELGDGHGLFWLGAAEPEAALPPVTAFWRDVGRAFVIRLCATPDLEALRAKSRSRCRAKSWRRWPPRRRRWSEAST